MIIPINFHKTKDKELLDWLNKKTNKSSYVRYVLEEKMREELRKNPQKENSPSSVYVSDNLINSIKRLNE